MRSEEGSAISVVFVLLLVGSMTAVAMGTGPDGAPADAAHAPDIQADDGADQTDGTDEGTDDGTVAGDETTIAVSATGEAAGDPDVAIVTLESAATADDPSTAADRLAGNASQLREALLGANLSGDQVRTTYYDLSADEPRPERDAPGNATEYTARQGFEVRLEQTDRVGDLIDLAVANGATGVRNVEFTVSDENRTDLRDRALESAMTDARGQAETLAATEDLTVTGAAHVSTVDGDVRPFVAQEADVAADAGTQIDGGPVTVHVRVEVTYEASAD